MMYENVASPSLTCPNQGNNQKIIILYIGRCSIILLILEMPGSVANRPLWQIGHCDSLGVNGSGCTVTTDRILLNESDAVMFHFHCFDFKDMPPSAWRRSHQHFILFEQESPVHTAYYTGLKLPLLTNYFNRTMTYRRRDSDISYLNTHGRLRCTKASPSSCLDFPHNTIDSDRLSQSRSQSTQTRSISSAYWIQYNVKEPNSRLVRFQMSRNPFGRGFSSGIFSSKFIVFYSGGHLRRLRY
jgi:hypothetical protein